LGVFGVGERLEAFVAAERCGSPLPDVARHVEAAVRGRARVETSDRRRAPAAQTEIATRRVRLLVAPGEAALRVVRRVPRGGLLPLGLRRQALAREARVCVGLVPTDARYRMVFFERRFVEHAAHDRAAAFAPPVERVNPIFFLAPAPALITPELAALVTAFHDEARELAARHGHARYPELRHEDLARG